MWINYLTPEGTRGEKSLCLNNPEVGGNFLGQENARLGMTQVLEKQPLNVVKVIEEMPPEAGGMPRAQWRGRGWREMGTELGARGSRGG